MVISRRIRSWLGWTIAAGALLLSMCGCGERDDLRYPNLPADHPLNHRAMW